MNTSERTIHIKAQTDDEIVKLAIAAKLSLVSETLADSRKSSAALHSTLASQNFQHIWEGGSESGLIKTKSASRTARNRKRQASRGFSFTIEGREGVYKLTPHNTGFERVNGAWNGNSPNWHERQALKPEPVTA